MTTKLATDKWLAGRYRFERELGRGATGRVVLAADETEGGGRRAVKLLDPAHAELVCWEFGLLSRIAHPNVARVFELLRVVEPVAGFDVAPGGFALVQEYAPGRRADEVADGLRRDRSGLLSLVRSTGAAVARALRALHGAGLVHGDVKPANVLVESPEAGCKLIDLGLARPPTAGIAPSGTPGFMAPEVWAGERNALTDIFALGTTLRHLLEPDRRALPSRGLRSPEPLSPVVRLPPLPDWVPEELRRLLESMTAEDPTLRPQTASDVVVRMRALGPAAGSREALAEDQQPSSAERVMALGALPLQGRDEELANVVDALSRPGMMVIHGPPGSGRSRLVREGVRRVQAERARRGGLVPTYRPVSRLPLAPIGHDCVLHVSDADGVEAGDVRALLQASAIAGFDVTVVLECAEDEDFGDLASAGRVGLGPLSAQATGDLAAAALGSAAGSEVREAALRVSGGLPGRLLDIMEHGFARGQDMSKAGSFERLVPSAPLSSRIPEPARELTRFLAVSGGSLPAGAALEVMAAPERVASASARLLSAGLATQSSGGALTLRPDVRDQALASMQPEEVARLAGQALPCVREPVARAHLLSAAGKKDSAIAAFRRVLSDLRRRGESDACASLARRALEALGEREPGLCAALADALRALGRYEAALEALAAEQSVETQLLRAEIARLKGDRTLAAQVASEVAAGGAGAHRHAALAILGRLALDRGELDEAERLVDEGRASAAEEVRARGLEVKALACLYAGRDREARGAIEGLLQSARSAGDALCEARAHGIRALVERGADARAAARHFADAFECAERAGELHTAATFLVNLGLSRLDLGELGPAIAALRDGARRLARIGRDDELGRALYNWAYATYLVGDDDSALFALDHAERASARPAVPAIAAMAAIVRGEIHARREQPEALVEVLKGLPACSSLPIAERVVVEARCATLWARVSGDDRATGHLTRARELLGETEDIAAEIECRVAEAMLAAQAGSKADAFERAELAHARASLGDRFDLRLRAALVAAQAATAVGREDVARARLGEVRALLDQAAQTMTPAERARMREVPAYRSALESVPRSDDGAAVSDDRWQRLAALAKRLAKERHLRRLYRTILDCAIELSGAERGFVVLPDSDGELRIRAARGIEGHDLNADDLSLSRSVISRVVAEQKSLATVDALNDERLDGVASVHALSLRSILAVPLSTRHQMIGAIYLDDRLRPFAFGDQELALLEDLADLAVLAIDNASLLRAQRRSARRIEAMRSRLAATVERQALEIAALRKGYGERGDDFGHIVGESAVLRRALEMVHKVAASDVPVLIVGESGTGKELVARAIHDTSPRRERPFISENFGAIAETLMESTLFGHVRGAFTGADRAHTGLFQAADGGTLFLDEIAEMQPSMQTRLLRVLQDGEVRPVGGERSRTVDVRVVAATHRNLQEMAAQGEFREDLYYRLAVVTIELPALRQRREDIPLLVAHLIEKHARGREVRIDRRAMTALSEYSWPGNIRQLENEIQRALLLAGDVIREDDLSATVLERDETNVGEFDLKGRVELLERDLIRRALEEVSGNQTRAAKLLGVSRYGLQKMLKRLGEDATVVER